MMVPISVGLMFSFMAFAYGYSKWDPNMKEIESWKKYRDDLMAEYKKRPQAEKRVKDAVALAKQKIAEWQQIAATRTLPPSLDQGGIDLGMNGWQMLTVLPSFRNSLQRQVNTQLRQGGVKILTAPTVPNTPTDPNKILDGYFNYPVLPPVVILDLGRIQVEGTYKQITDNVRAWSRMPHFLAVADGLSLQGTSPKLRGTYQVSIVGFVQVTKPLFPPVPEGGRLLPTADAGAPGATGAGGAPAAPAGGGKKPAAAPARVPGRKGP